MLRVGMTNPPYMLEHLPAICALLRHPRCYAFLHGAPRNAPQRTATRHAPQHTTRRNTPPQRGSRGRRVRSASLTLPATPCHRSAAAVGLERDAHGDAARVQRGGLPARGGRPPRRGALQPLTAPYSSLRPLAAPCSPSQPLTAPASPSQPLPAPASPCQSLPAPSSPIRPLTTPCHPLGSRAHARHRHHRRLPRRERRRPSGDPAAGAQVQVPHPQHLSVLPAPRHARGQDATRGHAHRQGAHRWPRVTCDM